MNTLVATTTALALLASVGICVSAQAQDKPASAANADKTQVVPGKKDLNPYPATIEKMDDNAQRIHDRDSAASSAAGGRSAARPVAAGVRDWAAIDTNKDNLISPEEMEAGLKAERASAAPASAPK